jgi:hypothetical protein
MAPAPAPSSAAPSISMPATTSAGISQPSRLPPHREQPAWQARPARPDGGGAVAQRQQLHVIMPQQQHVAHRHQGRADRIAQQPADGRLQASALVGQPLRLQGRGVAAHRLHHIVPGHGLNGIGDEGAAVIAAPFKRNGGAAAQQGIKALGPVAQARHQGHGVGGIHAISRSSKRPAWSGITGTQAGLHHSVSPAELATASSVRA